jgi:hypothetical protein
MSTNKVSPVGKMLSEVKRAYIAGVIDGDGAIMACIERHQEKKFRFRVRLILKATYSREQDVKEFLHILKRGRISKNRTTYDWILKNQQEIVHILNMISPYLRVKRRQALIAQKIGERNVETRKDLLYVARLADTLSAFNLRSRGRRKNYAAMIQESISRND